MKGCLGCVGVIFCLFLLFGAFDIAKLAFRDIKDSRDARLAEKAEQEKAERVKEEEAARIAEAKRKQAEAEAEARRLQELKDAKIQEFALKDAPKVWQVYQSLQGAIDMQSGKLEELRKTLVTFGKQPEQDEDFKRICAVRDDMISTRKALRAKLEDAYIAAKKYEASPSRKDYQETMKRALEDGVNDANMATERYKAMTRQK